MRNPVQGWSKAQIHVLRGSLPLCIIFLIKQDQKCMNYCSDITHTLHEYLCTSSFQSAPPSFVAIVPCPNFKVICSQWLESRFLCKQNACYGCPHSHFTVVFSSHTSRWSETNIICRHISRRLSIIWLVPVQAQRVFISVQG